MEAQGDADEKETRGGGPQGMSTEAQGEAL